MTEYETYGSTTQLVIKNLSDLDRVLKLKDAHWMALTAPVSDFNFDPQFLDDLDLDGDGRIRVGEVRVAIEWLRAVTKVTQPSDTIKLEELESEPLRESFRKLVNSFSLAEPASVSLKQLRELRLQYAEDPVEHGSGSLQPDEVDDSQERELLHYVLEAVGPEVEAVTEEQLDQFLEDSSKLLAWRQASPGDEGWVEGFPVFKALKPKIESYFFEAEVAAFTKDVKRPFWPEVEDQAALQSELAKQPLVQPYRLDVLDFQERLNPHYRENLNEFQRIFLQEGERLERQEFEELKVRFDNFADWLSEAPDTRLTDLSSADLARLCENPELVGRVRKSLQEKRRTGLVQADFNNLEKLLLYRSLLVDFCRNFVAFPNLYDANLRASFERGTLVLDGREFHLCLPVDVLKQHKSAASRSQMFVLYFRANERTFASPVTSGSKGNLAIGKRGVFHHVNGTELEAEVVDIVVNPISLWEAILAPFRKLADAVKDRVENLSSDREKALVDSATQKSPSKKDSTNQGTMLAGGGVAIAALGSSFAFVFKTLSSITPASALLGTGLLLLGVMIPACLVAFLKLRSRDLSSVLEGNGWGINARMRLTRAQAHQFTQEPRHPGYVSSRAPWMVSLTLLAVVLYWLYREGFLTVLSQSMGGS